MCTRRKERITSSRHVLSTIAKAVRGCGNPPLGPDFSRLTGEALADALVAHRFVKNLPVKEINSVERRRRTLRETLEYDTNGLSTFDWRSLPQPIRGQFLRAKANLAAFFAGFTSTYSAKFPSGETAVTAHGDVSLISKLSDPEQWRVSLEAAPYVATICYKNPHLRRIVKERFRATHEHWKFYADQWFATTGSRFQTFKNMFIACCAVQNYSRLSSVTKNAEKDRPISMEPFWNMVGQLSFARDLRRHLRETLGIDLDNQALLHSLMVQFEREATIDFSNASNSNWVCVLRELLPARVMGVLDRLRTPITYDNGTFHYWNMLSPMGNGFTFEVMTIVLLHLARVFDPSASVFGDDVVILGTQAKSFITLAESLGWKINSTKTFVEGNFRESCGEFYDLVGSRSLKSYEFHAPADLLDCATNANKIFRILEARQISARLRQILILGWVELVKLLPHVVWRSSADVTETLPSGVVLVPPEWYRNVCWREPTGMELEYGRMYHREVAIRSQIWKTLTSVPHETASPRVQLATAILQGSIRKTLKGESKVVLRSVISPGNGAIADCPLLSVL